MRKSLHVNRIFGLTRCVEAANWTVQGQREAEQISSRTNHSLHPTSKNDFEERFALETIHTITAALNMHYRSKIKYVCIIRAV